MAIATRLTLGEFTAIPDFGERRLELIDGEVLEKPSLFLGPGPRGWSALRRHGGVRLWRRFAARISPALAARRPSLLSITA